MLPEDIEKRLSKCNREIKSPRESIGDERATDHIIKETELELIVHQPPMQIIK
jgi:hypothetical protein